MGTYSQAEHQIKVGTVLGEDVLLLQNFSGEEAVSAPFHFRLAMRSENHAIAADSLLRTPVTVTLDLIDGGERTLHGLISRFSQLGRYESLTTYSAEMVPWFWFLSLSSDCKIFQNMSVLEIVESVFHDQEYSDFDIRCLGSYPKREYCVQYRETHLNFVSRLAEEEGIFYFFEHSKDKHVLVLADHNSAVKPCPGLKSVRMAPAGQGLQDEEMVTELQREHSVGSGIITLRDYDYLKPTVRLESSISGEQKEEIYDYPGTYLERTEGDRYARLRLEEREAMLQVVRGVSNVRAFQPGFRFDLSDHYSPGANQRYHLLQVRHMGTAEGLRSGQGGGVDYSNEFVAVPHKVPYRPPRTTPEPIVSGSQTAVVVGKAGEEIWTDKHGRVKVQFHWDRLGKKNEKSSCWVRVSSTWAGKNWGFIQIPRIGQEVVVDFLEGDPDQPIITGRVYNADQVPPYGLPASQTQSGVKSRSSKGGTGENFNEIRLEDMKGSEELYIHAEKNETHEVENDRSDSVGHDERISIGHDRTESVGNDESITIERNRTESVGKDETISIGNNRSESVTKNESIDIGENRTESVGKREEVSVGDSRAHSVGKDDTLNVAKNLLVEVGDSITFRTGDASITMKKNGDIQIKGKNLRLDGSGKIQATASSDVNIKGSKVTNN